jgi:N-sulfoglucosamine sulfohydrolase
MNILYIHTHDTGRFIQPYGHAVPTPNLMALAREGAPVRTELAERLERWMRATADPLLAGPVPKPAGARVNLKWALHPNEQEFEA